MSKVWIAAVAASVSVRSAAQAGEYYRVAGTSSSAFVVDEESLVRDGAARTFVMISVFEAGSAFRDNGIDHLVSKERIDCRSRVHWNVYSVGYSKSGAVVDNVLQPQAPNRIVSGSTLEGVQKFVCQPGLAAQQVASVLPPTTTSDLVAYVHAHNAAADTPARAGVRKHTTRTGRRRAAD